MKNFEIYMGYEVRENEWGSNQSPLREPWKKTGRINEYTGLGNVTSIGPTGSGKSSKLLLPNLLWNTDCSIVVTDPKGDLAISTARHRAENGSQIIVIDPFRVIAKQYPEMVEKLVYLQTQGFNPIAMLDPDSEDFIDDAMAIAEALIKVEGKDAHWGKSAQALLAGLIMSIRMTLAPDDPQCSLVGLRSLLGMAPDALGEYIKDIINAAESEPAIAAKLNRFTQINSDNKELLSILSTAITQTDWLDSKPIRRVLSGGTLDFAELKKRPITVYLVLPPRYLETHATWLRLMITAALTPLIRSTALGTPVLFMLDEFAQLGRLEVIERNLALMRGYGIKLWIVLQDLSQLQDNYQIRWHSFIANSGIIQCFAPQDLKTREYISKLSGQQLIWVDSNSTSVSETQGWSPAPLSKSATTSRSQISQPVYPEEALAQMGDDQAVLFEAKKPPRRTLLPDPLQLPYVGEILKNAVEYAAKYEVGSEM